MASGGSADDLQFVLVDPAACVTPQDLLVAVVAELLGEGADVGP